ncbi:MAG: CrcB family protein [Mycobacteriales bacterium]
MSRIGVDPDQPPGPPPGHARAALVVGLGGAIGGLARAGVAEVLPHAPGSWAWSTFVANATGGFALAALVVVLSARAPAGHYPRLLLGTGVLGGYTTFSTFSVDAVELLRAGREPMAAAYVLVSVVVLLVATVLGLWLGRAVVGGRLRGAG